MRTITDLWLRPSGGVQAVVCPCLDDTTGEPLSCDHAVGLLARLIEGLHESSEPAVHPLLSRSAAQVRARLRRNDAQDLWELPGAQLYQRHFADTAPAGATVGEALLGDAAAWGLPHRTRLAEAFERELAQRRLGRKAAPWRAQAAESAHVQAFLDAVQTERSRRLAHTASLHAPGEPLSGRLRVDVAPLTIHWTSMKRRCATTGGPLRLTMAWGGDGLRLRCDDGTTPVDTCPDAVDLLGGVLDHWAGHGSKRSVAALREGLAAPPWRQDVASLDAVFDSLGIAPTPAIHTAKSEDDPDEMQLGWQVDWGDGYGWWIRPVMTRPYKRRTGLRIFEVHPYDLTHKLERYTRQDRAILRVAGSAYGLHRCQAPAAFAAAIDHPRLIGADQERVRLRMGSLGLHLSATPDGGVAVGFRDGASGRTLPADSVAALLQRRQGGAICVDTGTHPWTVLPIDDAMEDLAFALIDAGMRFPAGARGAMLERLPALRAVFDLDLDASLSGRAVAPDLRPFVRLAPLRAGPIEVEVALRPLPGGPLVAPGAGPVELEGVSGAERVHTVRQMNDEAAAVREALGPDADLLDAGPVSRLDLTDDTLARLQRLQERAEAGALTLEWTHDALRVTGTAGPRALRVSIGGGRDWLGLGGELQVGGASLDLHRVMEAVRTGRRFVQLDSGDWVSLTDQLRDRLARLSRRVRTDRRGRTSLAPLSGEALAELAEAGAEVEMPPSLQVEAARLRESRDRDFSVPDGLQATLRPYQADGLRWLQRLAHWAPGACLADDMGLGKTLQALGLLLHRQTGGPALVVAPTSLAANWVSEAARFAPGLELRTYRGRDRERLLHDVGPGVVLVTSYDLMRRDAEQLGALDFHTVVFDESQALKNPASQTARVAVGLRGRFCLALSGTPVENRSEELWSLFRGLVPGLLGSLQWFRDALARPADLGDPEARARLAALVAPFLLRRTKAEVAQDLPARTEQLRRIALTSGERRLYDAARLAAMQLREEDPRQARFAVLKALTRLRQLACDPRLVDPSTRVRSSKLAALRELVDGLVQQGEQVLVFSQFTSLLDRAGGVLDHHRLLRLDGRTPAGTRARRVSAFQQGDADVFLISRKAGGTGLNLTAATIVIHLDPWWNPAAEDQATDRAHRIGQHRPVTVYRLIAEGTVEEGVLEMQAAKRELVEGLLSGARKASAVSFDDLMALVAGAA
jgi:hypothetical protein